MIRISQSPLLRIGDRISKRKNMEKSKNIVIDPDGARNQEQLRRDGQQQFTIMDYFDIHD
jgi:hypothetical protein